MLSLHSAQFCVNWTNLKCYSSDKVQWSPQHCMTQNASLVSSAAVFVISPHKGMRICIWHDVARLATHTGLWGLLITCCMHYMIKWRKKTAEEIPQDLMRSINDQPPVLSFRSHLTKDTGIGIFQDLMKTIYFMCICVPVSSVIKVTTKTLQNMSNESVVTLLHSSAILLTYKHCHLQPSCHDEAANRSDQSWMFSSLHDQALISMAYDLVHSIFCIY